MPLYEYQCKECGQSFELLVLNLSSAAPAKCPHCGDANVRKKLSTFSSKGASGSGSVSLSSSGSSCNTGG